MRKHLVFASVFGSLLLPFSLFFLLGADFSQPKWEYLIYIRDLGVLGPKFYLQYKDWNEFKEYIRRDESESFEIIFNQRNRTLTNLGRPVSRGLNLSEENQETSNYILWSRVFSIITRGEVTTGNPAGPVEPYLLAILGEQGWELATTNHSASSSEFHFKRRK